MSIDVEGIAGQMIGAVRDVVDDRWPTIQNLAADELRDLAQILARIEARKRTGIIGEAEATALFKVHKNATRVVLAGLQGMTLVLAEEAINAALNVIKTAINDAVGFVLI